MESLGNKLRSVRESKGYTYEHVGRETNIARRYIEALETEDFAKFPGEPYLLGFLKNYGEYLGLDVTELLALYKAIKIQEQPVPVEQLLRSTPSFPRVPVILFGVLVLLACAAAGAYFFVINPRSKREVVEPVQKPVEYTLDGGSLERRFYRGDTILAKLGNDLFKMELRDMTDPFSLFLPRGRQEFVLGMASEVDLNGDGFNDLIITLADYDKASPSSGALVRFDMNLIPDAAAVEEPDAARASTVIFSSSTPYPFTLQIQFQGYCMFRWDVDRRERNEQYFARNDELNLQGQNGIRLWVSNAAAVRIQAIGAGRTVPLELGAAGEVVVTELRWFRNDDGRFRLVQSRLD